MKMAIAQGPGPTPAMTNEAVHIASPSDSFGTLSVAELVGTDTEASTVYSFPSGLNGVTVSNYCPSVWNTAETDNVLVYVAFNNTPFDHADQAGLRYIVGPNQSMSWSFKELSKPTTMTIRVDATQCTVFHVAAEV